MYDNHILNYCLNNQITTDDILEYSNIIITTKVSKPSYSIKFGQMCIDTIDVFKMVAPSASLKLIAFIDYKYLFANNLTATNFDTLCQYNLEDLQRTFLIFKDKCIPQLEITQYLGDYLKIPTLSSNLMIYKYLSKAEYNPNYNFSTCLDRLQIDEDLKNHALNLLNNSELDEIRTTEGLQIKKGGIHYPTDTDFIKKGIQFYDVAYNFDFESYYPNIYINLLDFFGEKTKIELKKILDERLHSKQIGDTLKSNALKLFINSIYGQLAKQNLCYMHSVALLGQILLIQLIRDNKIKISDIIEINTDGILLKQDYQLENISSINFEKTIYNKLYHKNSNMKFYYINNNFVAKGSILTNNNYTNNLNFFSLGYVQVKKFIIVLL